MKFRLALAVVALLLAGCAKKNQTPEAVKQGVIRDISKKMNMQSMDVNVDSVSFRDKEADATVTFTLKGGSRDQGMSMKYVMEQHDDGQWYIKTRSSMEAPAAGGGEADAPAGTGAAAATGATLPPGHPPLGQNQ